MSRKEILQVWVLNLEPLEITIASQLIKLFDLYSFSCQMGCEVCFDSVENFVDSKGLYDGKLRSEMLSIIHVKLQPLQWVLPAVLQRLGAHARQLPPRSGRGGGRQWPCLACGMCVSPFLRAGGVVLAVSASCGSAGNSRGKQRKEAAGALARLRVSPAKRRGALSEGQGPR